MTTNSPDLIARNALAWARERIGNPDYLGMCLAFVEDAIEQSNQIEVFGGDSAQESADLYGAADHTGEPPLGALMFYACEGDVDGEHVNWGHVGLCDGAGHVIHAYGVVREDDMARMPALPPAPGWTPLTPIGWAPLERVLQGAQDGAPHPAD